MRVEVAAALADAAEAKDRWAHHLAAMFVQRMAQDSGQVCASTGGGALICDIGR